MAIFSVTLVTMRSDGAAGSSQRVVKALRSNSTLERALRSIGWAELGVSSTGPKSLVEVSDMPKKRSKSTAARQRATWRVYALAGALLLFMLGGVVASQLLWASATPEPAVSDALSPVPLPANGEAGDNSAHALNLYGSGMRPLVEERDGVQTLNIYGPGGQIIAQVVRDGQGSEEVRYLLTDHLGSTRAVVDAEGNAVASYEYAPHGETTAAGTAAAEVRYRYTGHPYDEGQEVYETPARAYDPTLGRFLSVDPQRDDASPYVYAGNNPVGYVDPTGGIRIRVPFFVVSGMEVNSMNHGGALSRSIARGFGLRSDQIVYPSDIFMGVKDSRGFVRQSSAETRASILNGGGRRDEGTAWKVSRKLYWFIGKDEPVTDPNRLESALDRMREIRPGFADEIVVIDFSGDANKIGPIMRRLSGQAKPARLVEAGLVLGKVTGHRRSPYRPAEAMTHGGEQYTVDEFGDRVKRTRDLDSGVLEGNPSSSQKAGATGTAGQKRPGMSLDGDETSVSNNPKTLSPAQQYELSTERYTTSAHMDSYLLSAFEGVPEGAWEGLGE